MSQVSGLQVGSKVMLRAGYNVLAIPQASHPPLRPGDIGTVTGVHESGDIVSVVVGTSSTVQYQYRMGALLDVQSAVLTSQTAKAGVRVQRGPHWKWWGQDCNDGVGTLLSSTSKGWWRVRWPDGFENTYRVGEDGSFDLRLEGARCALIEQDADERQKIETAMCVKLCAAYEQYSDASKGPLLPDQLAVVVKVSRRVNVVIGTRAWWYDKEALCIVREQPGMDAHIKAIDQTAIVDGNACTGYQDPQTANTTAQLNGLDGDSSISSSSFISRRISPQISHFVGQHVMLRNGYNKFVISALPNEVSFRPGDIGIIARIDGDTIDVQIHTVDNQIFVCQASDIIPVESGVITSNNAHAGQRVLRGPHWKWDSQDGSGEVGMLLNPSSDGWWRVRWSNGFENAYRSGAGGSYDLRPEGSDVALNLARHSLKEGQAVRLATCFQQYSDAGQGPMTLKDIGTVLAVSRRIHVQALSSAKSWWYDSECLVASHLSGPMEGMGDGKQQRTSHSLITSENARVGARVRRGRDWKWKDQDGGQGNLGTIVEAVTEQGWVKVQWDGSDQQNRYRAGHMEYFDLELCDTCPKESRQLSSGEKLNFVGSGCSVLLKSSCIPGLLLDTSPLQPGDVGIVLEAPVGDYARVFCHKTKKEFSCPAGWLCDIEQVLVTEKNARWSKDRDVVMSPHCCWKDKIPAGSKGKLVCQGNGSWYYVDWKDGSGMAYAYRTGVGNHYDLVFHDAQESISWPNPPCGSPILGVGCEVILAESTESEGCLDQGDVGHIVSINTSNPRPYKVRNEHGHVWRYSEQELALARPLPIVIHKEEIRAEGANSPNAVHSHNSWGTDGDNVVESNRISFSTYLGLPAISCTYQCQKSNPHKTFSGEDGLQLASTITACPGLLSVYSRNTTADGLSTVVMQHWNTTLRGYLDALQSTGKRLQTETTLTIAIKLVRTLSHLQQIAFKPHPFLCSSTLVCTDQGKTAEFKLRLIDFENCWPNSDHPASLIAKWQAPETLGEGSMIDSKSNVYTVGVIMWEMLTLETPWPGLSSSMTIPEISSYITSNPLQQPHDASPALRGLLVQCMHQDPSSRPTLLSLQTTLCALRKEVESDLPNEFQCPVTLEVMRDPVVLCDGHTYERETIEQWLKEHDTSPLTGQILANKLVFPNFKLRSLIQDHFGR